MMASGQGKKLPVYIVEQHNDVVPFIHRAIASKRLPYSGIPIIHLDSHPDLLIPIHLDAETVFKPQELYDTLSIENWILPLCYAKHIDHVIWVKPPWASQIKTSEQTFHVGKCQQTGKLRMSCKENYFLTEGLFCAHKDLENPTDCKLTVVKILPDKWMELNPQCVDSIPSNQGDKNVTLISPENNANCEVDTKDKNTIENLFESHELWSAHLHEVVTSRPYILDIDLDFFSVKNPFKEVFQPEEEIVQKIFKRPVLNGLLDKDVISFTSQRQKQLEQLEFVFTALNDKWIRDGEDDISDVVGSPEEISKMSLSEFTGLGAEQLDFFNLDEQESLTSLCRNVIPTMRDREIDFTQIYDFGCTLDDTELPHHVSNDTQIKALISSFQSVLTNLHKPSIVTISRSSYDDYCPMDQVDEIESLVLKLVSDMYGSLQITRNYDE